MQPPCPDFSPTDPCSPANARNKGGQGFCSKHYQRRRYHDTLPTLAPSVCEHCGTGFTPQIRRRDDRSRWCSKLCRDRHAAAEKKRVRPASHCIQCDADISHLRAGARYCSESCAQKWRREQRLGGRPERVCHGCGEEVSADRRRGAIYCSEACKIKSRRHQKYGLTKSELDLLLAQGESCAICNGQDWGVKGPVVDHEHSSGRVRSILCGRCNTGLGQFRDDPALLRAAADYLERHTVTV